MWRGGGAVEQKKKKGSKQGQDETNSSVQTWRAWDRTPKTQVRVVAVRMSVAAELCRVNAHYW